MRRLAVLILALLFTLIPTGIAYGACNSTDTMDQEVDQGIPVLVVDADGKLLGCGRIVPRTGTAARQYDASTGRFISMDPVEWPKPMPYMNTYQYALNNPLVHTDPSGEFVPLVVNPVTIAVGGAILTGIGACVIYCDGDGPGVGGNETTPDPVTPSAGPANLCNSGPYGYGFDCGGTEADPYCGGRGSDARVVYCDSILRNDGGEGGVDPRDVHGEVNSGRDVDVEDVIENGEVLIDTETGNVIHIRDNGNGTSDIVIRDPSNPSGKPVTQYPAGNGYVDGKIERGQWEPLN